MSVATTQATTLSATELDVTSSRDVIAQALARCVPVQLSAIGAPNAAVWRGTFQSGTADALVVVPVDRWVEWPGSWCEASLRATFCVAHKAYAFDTRLAAPTPVQRAETIGLRRPSRIEQIERRRALRRRFHASTCVRLRVDPGSSAPIDTTLLNLSAHGLACRGDMASVDWLPVGTCVRAHFDGPVNAGSFDLDAQIVAATPSGAGDVVFGLEFVANDLLSSQRDRLGDLLSVGKGISEPGRTRPGRNNDS